MSRYRDTPPLDFDGPPDLREAEWFRVATAIAHLRAEGAHVWAEETLAGLEDDIRETQLVTDFQRRALARITGTAWAPGRAFDAFGYGRRWR